MHSLDMRFPLCCQTGMRSLWRCTLNQDSFKTRGHTILTSRFVVECITEGAPVCGVLSRVAEAVVAELRVVAVTDLVEQFLQTFAVLQRTTFLD